MKACCAFCSLFFILLFSPMLMQAQTTVEAKKKNCEVRTCTQTASASTVAETAATASPTAVVKTKNAKCTQPCPPDCPPVCKILCPEKCKTKVVETNGTEAKEASPAKASESAAGEVVAAQK